MNSPLSNRSIKAHLLAPTDCHSEAFIEGKKHLLDLIAFLQVAEPARPLPLPTDKR